MLLKFPRLLMLIEVDFFCVTYMEMQTICSLRNDCGLDLDVVYMESGKLILEDILAVFFVP